MSDMDIPGERRGVPLRGIVMIVWIVVYLLLMWHSGWPWESASIWNAGSPADVTLERSGAMVPARASWERFLLSPWLHRTALGLALYLLFWSGTAKQMIGIAGTTRTWLLFVLGGAAGAAAHMLSYPESTIVAGAGPFDAIAALIGAALCWGFVSKAPGAARVRNGAIVSVLVIGGFTWYSSSQAGGNPDVWKLIGLEAMLGGFACGFVLMALFGPRTLDRRPGPVVRCTAFVLTLAVVAAGVSQGAQLLASADRSSAGAFLARLLDAEQSAYELSRDQVGASDAKRADLSRRLEATLATEFLEGYEGLEALRAYTEALRLYTKPVRLPWVAEDACRKAFDTWYQTYEKPLRESRGLRARNALHFYWKKP